MKRSLLVLVCIALAAWSACSSEKPVHLGSTAEGPEAPTSAAFGNKRTTDRIPTSKGDLVVSPLEHASVLFGWDGKSIYVDPTTTAIEDVSFPKANVVFVTESRFEHLDPIAMGRLRIPGTIVVGPPDAAARTPLDVVMGEGDTRTVAGIVATAVPMYSLEHGPAPGLLYHPRGHGIGYVLDLGGTRVYLSGDTECTPEVKALEHVDVAFLAVNPPEAMSPADAVRCIEAFRPKIVFPYHDRHVDLTELERALPGLGVELRERNFFPRPERWRRDAVTACADRWWGVCRDRLDLARGLDPESEEDPRVIHAREQVRAWRSPFPAWW
jgi:L-ascorbate metabolism protein UlaG (beta-lactamase superfamily)